LQDVSQHAPPPTKNPRELNGPKFSQLGAATTAYSISCETLPEGPRTKQNGYARVSTKAHDADRQIQDPLATAVHRDTPYIDHGQSGALTKRPGLNKALNSLHPEDALVITTLDWLGRSTQKMLDLAQELRERNIGLRVLNLGGGDLDTKTPMGAMVFTVMA